MEDGVSFDGRRAALLRDRAGLEPIWLPVEGPSMDGTITPPGRVLVAGATAPRRGEIWAFEGSGGITVHRFRAEHDGRHWFRGDGNRYDDRPVDADALIGRVIRIEDRSGTREVGRRDRLRGRLRLDVDSVRRRLRHRLRHRPPGNPRHHPNC